MVFNCMKVLNLCQIYLAEGLFDREQANSLLRTYCSLDAHAQEWVRKIITTGEDDTSPWLNALNRLLIIATQLSLEELALLETKIGQVTEGNLICPPCTEEIEIRVEEEIDPNDEVVYDLCACDLIWLIQQIGRNGLLCCG